MTPDFSSHSKVRIQQRGLLEDDISPILKIGTMIGDDSVMLLNKDVAREIQKLKKEITQLERLKGCRVVYGCDGKIITVYRPNKKLEKRLLRKEH